MRTAIDKIIRITDAQSTFWRASHGWAPIEAANLLSKSRLDRQTSLARTLHDYAAQPNAAILDARLILGYVTLRSLCEGLIKLTFSVHYLDYQKDVNAIRRKGAIADPDEMTLDPLIGLYDKVFSDQWVPYLRCVQAKGNAIHGFKDRSLGTFAELQSCITQYRDFLIQSDGKLPYPDEICRPSLY